MEQRQRHQSDVLRHVLRWMQPRRELKASRHEASMRSDDGFRHARCAAAHEHDRGIVGRRCSADLKVGTTTVSVLQTILEPQIAGFELNAMAAFLFLEDREEYLKQPRQIFLDAGRDDALHARVALNFFQASVERRERYDELDSCRSERFAKFAGGVERIERHHGRAGFPRADFCDQELRTVGENERDAVALFYTGADERCGKAVAQSVESFIREGRTLEKYCRRIRQVTRGLAYVVNERLIRVRNETGRNFRIVVTRPGSSHW